MVTLYTAVGRFEKRRDGEGRSYPVVVLGGKEQILGIPEMVVWTSLNWRILEMPKIEELYTGKTAGILPADSPAFQATVGRLLQRGIMVDGKGDTAADALHDLLGGLYIVPLACGLPAKILSFLKLTFIRQMPFCVTRRIFQKASFTPDEKQVMSLARQAPLSAAEVMKCVEYGITDVSTGAKLMDALYGDETTTSESLPEYARLFAKRQGVLATIANLYLRQLILFERPV